MAAWMSFVTTLIWQLMVVAALVAIYRTGLLHNLAKIELSPKGIILEIANIRERQDKLQRDVNALTFLIRGFLTTWELTQLEKLAGDKPFDYHWGGDRNDRFVQELIRLWDFGLIARKGVKSWYDIPRVGNLREFAEITPRGRDYLVLRQQVQADEEQGGKQLA